MAPDDDADGNREHVADVDGRGSKRHRGRTVAGAVLLVVVLLVVWSVGIEPRLILEEQEEIAYVPELTEAWDGAEIGVISDLQVGMWWGNVGMAERAVDELVERDPDAVLILGDFVYGQADTADDVDRAVDVVRPLADADIPTFAVFGNHDHATGAVPLLRDRLEEIGVQVLEDEAVTLRRDGEPLHIAGIAPPVSGEVHPEAAVDGIPDDEARVVMMHNPATFDELPAGSAPLAVAGHTHGGQFRVPFLPEWSFLGLLKDDPVHVDGWIDGYGAEGNHLFVNRGIGMSIIPARFNCSPAITIFQLRSRQA